MVVSLSQELPKPATRQYRHKSQGTLLQGKNYLISTAKEQEGRCSQMPPIQANTRYLDLQPKKP